MFLATFFENVPTVWRVIKPYNFNRLVLKIRRFKEFAVIKGVPSFDNFRGDKSILGGQICYFIYKIHILIKKFALGGHVLPRGHGWLSLEKPDLKACGLASKATKHKNKIFI